MKFMAYLLFFVLILSLILTPLTELMLAFTDKIRINSAIASSSRSAMLASADKEYSQDGLGVIKFYDADSGITLDEEKNFLHKFIENFCISLKLSPSAIVDYRDNGLSKFEVILMPDNSDRFNAFQVIVTPISEFVNGLGNTEVKRDPETNELIYNKCELVIETLYKFKTTPMRSFSDSTTLRVRWTIKLENMKTQ